MKEEDVIKILIDLISKQFPKQCNNCGKSFESFAEYIQNTTHVGKPISYDAELQDWKPHKPIGGVAAANCSCGSTLSVDSQGIGLATMWKLLDWARKESKTRGISISELLDELRDKIEVIVLQDYN